MTVESATTAELELGLGNGTRHLIHCPPSWDHYLLDAPSSSEEHFVLAGEMPAAHPLFNDGPAHFHDLQVITETVREIGEFVGHRYFGVPEERPGLFHRFHLDLTELRGWRVGPQRPHMTTNIRARPANVVNGVPRGLEFFLDVSIDDTACAMGTAGLVFLTPILHRNHAEHSRRAVRAVPEFDDVPDGPTEPVAPQEVGRAAEANVVVSEPVPSTHGRLSTWVGCHAENPLFAADSSGHVSGMLLLESLRQTSLLTAGRAFGLNPARSTLGASQVRFRGYAEADLPLRCAAVPGPLDRDVDGRPAVCVTLTATQHRRAVAEATMTVVQDF